MNQQDKARAFAALHNPSDPLILFNIWDAGSAKAVAAAGGKALATGSASVAAANGFGDGEALPLDMAIANIARIAGAVDLPVSIDFEGGYGNTPEAVGENFARAVAAGAIGCNFEDQIVGGEGLYPIADQAERIAALRSAANRAGVDAFINARTDIFLKSRAHDADKVDDAIARARAYAAAGANGFFAPGLHEETLISRLCEGSPIPVNIMWFPGVPSAARLGELGVARVSHGPGPYTLAMKALEDAAREAFGK